MDNVDWILTCGLFVITWVLVIATGLAVETNLETDLAARDSAVARQMDEVYDALRCERTAEFPTVDGEARTIVIYVCHQED